MSNIFLLIPLSFLVYFSVLFSQAPGPMFSLPWVPAFGVHFSFALSKLSLFLGLLIAFIGTLITFYATQYMKLVKDELRFWTFFLSFMVSMIGLVFSDNLISLFLFWEATSICSFFLIGHFHDDENARKSALNSLLITGGGGIFLLLGLIGFATMGGSYELSTLIQNKALILEHPLVLLPFLFTMIGVMTKSAQFPFHFWLPMAMTGPAPVSSFLHSATMVKAGVFLLAKLFPLLSEISYWEPIITTVGLTTFVWGGIVAVRHFDLKMILANTTISALGCLIALIGMAKASPKALEAYFLFFLAHAFYKAALFMCTGTIEKKFKRKDIREIRLSFKDDPLLALSLFVSCFSMMGLPPTIGFVAKETFLEFSQNNLVYLLPLMLGGLLNFVAAGKVLYFLLLSQREPSELKYTSSTFLLSAPSFVLSLGTLLLAVSGPLGLNDFINSLVSEVNGLNSDVHVALWHGLNLPLMLSLVTVILGIMILFLMRTSRKGLEDNELSTFSPTRIYTQSFAFLLNAAAAINSFYQSGYLRRYFLTIFSASSFILLLGIWYFQPTIQFVNSPIHFIDICLGLIMVFSTVATIVTESKIWAVTQIGIVGTCLILFFIFYGAPDLALTQLLVEIFTLTIFVFALHRLPKLRTYSSFNVRSRDFVIAAIFGIIMSCLTYFSFGTQLEKTVAGFYTENAYLEAYGKNIVNVILVDFRSFDTLGEVSVILMAALGVYILMRKRGAS